MTTRSLGRVSLEEIAFDRIPVEASSLETVTDGELLERIVRVAGATRYLTAELLALIGECDARRLYLGEGCSSLFTYCTQVLHLSEHAAYHRIEAARAARRFPMILAMVAEGAITLTTIALLRPHLTVDNHRQLLAAARHRSKREVEYQVACLAPKADAATLVRRLPAHAPVEGALLAAATGVAGVPGVAAAAGVAEGTVATEATVAPTDTADAAARPTVAAGGGTLVTPRATSPLVEPRSLVAPLAVDRYLLRVTLSAETHAKLRRAQALMGHRVPEGDPAAIISEALSLFVDHLERTKFAHLRRPRRQSGGQSAPPLAPAAAASAVEAATSAAPTVPPSATPSAPPQASSAAAAAASAAAPASASADGSRHIPAAMRRHVWARDEGRCAFVGSHGRCTEIRQLEFHHVVPFARGGPTVVENLALRCRAHNVYESDQAFGPRVGQNGGLTTETDLLDEAPH
jgi:hypothetical protein